MSSFLTSPFEILKETYKVFFPSLENEEVKESLLDEDVDEFTDAKSYEDDVNNPENVNQSFSTLNNSTSNSSMLKLSSSLSLAASFIPFKKQIDDFDCGLTCCSMIFSSLGIPKTSVQDLIDFVNPLDSIWTIDLAYLLREKGIKDFSTLFYIPYWNKLYPTQKLKVL
ncbi:hypothetical protein HK099_003099 [Clydaea vesicula]|uniref:Guanylyl cyclase n=1 Tax=Clydaea vesicula TaxID=447962 RepID=A0AAD5TUJ1_9FUNG|nr:hypothetical protein HK099_003099 [Clydaea vesicula]